VFLQADQAGRLAFDVDLGPAHTLEELTDAEVAAAAADPDYFQTRQVQFLPLGGHGGCDDDGDSDNE
jgi:hypothetical protein